MSDAKSDKEGVETPAETPNLLLPRQSDDSAVFKTKDEPTPNSGQDDDFVASGEEKKQKKAPQAQGQHTVVQKAQGPSTLDDVGSIGKDGGILTIMDPSMLAVPMVAAAARLIGPHLMRAGLQMGKHLLGHMAQGVSDALKPSDQPVSFKLGEPQTPEAGLGTPKLPNAHGPKNPKAGFLPQRPKPGFAGP